MFGGIANVGEGLKEALKDIDRWKFSIHSPQLAGLGTGFDNVDHLTSGIRPGSLCVIASRPSIGKSTFALNIATHVSLNENQPVLIFKPDSSAMLITKMLLSRLSEVELNNLITCELTEDDLNRVNGSKDILNGMPLFIDESPSLTVEAIIDRIRLAEVKYGKLGLVIIDHLQLISPLNSNEATTEDYEQIVIELKRLAQRINTPIILLSTLNRNLERRTDKRALISDLPDQVVGQYSDLLIFLYRDEIYNPDSDRKGMMDICIAQNRFGHTGTVLLGTGRLKYGELISPSAGKTPC